MRFASFAAACAGFLVALASCAEQTPVAPIPISGEGEARVSTPALAPLELPDGPAVKVLFVGNSLTAGNNLPAIVQAMAAAGHVRLEYQMCAPGGTSLEDQWLAGRARKLLTETQWDYLVLRQGPSTLVESQANLKEWAGKWIDEAMRLGAKPALYMVWPQKGQKDGFSLVSRSYRSAAKAQTLVLPAGEAWEKAIREDASLALYQVDGLHPTEAGSYLAALVIVQGLTGVHPAKVPSRLALTTGQTLSLSDDLAAKLRQAAQAVSPPKK